VTIPGGHGFKVGDTIIASGLSGTGITYFANVTTLVTAVGSATQFSYTDSINNSTASTQSVSGSFVGNITIATAYFYDYGYPTRTIGAATRNNTADVTMDGQLAINAQVAGNAMVAKGNASNFSAEAIFADANGNARFGIDSQGMASLGNVFDWRENWLWAAGLGATSASPLTNSSNVWAWTVATGTPTYSSGTGFNNSPIGQSLVMNIPATLNSAALLRTTSLSLAPYRLTNLYAVLEWTASLSVVTSNGVTITMGMNNGNPTSTSTPGGFRFVKASADATWQCYTDDGSVIWKADSGVAPVAGNANAFRIEFYGAGTPAGAATVKFYIDNLLVATSTTAIFTSGVVQICFSALNTVASAMTIGLGPLRFMFNQVASPLIP
jgi:hypothetical protein